MYWSGKNSRFYEWEYTSNQKYKKDSFYSDYKMADTVVRARLQFINSKVLLIRPEGL